MASMNMAQNAPKGLLTPGTIDLAKRPVVRNPDGTISTVRSMSFGEDGREVLIPTVSPDGRVLSDQDAINLYHQTGQHLGMFDNPEDATMYAQALHEQQAGMYGDGAQGNGAAADPGNADKWAGAVTLDIEGHEIEVDKSFLSMSPDQQNATVEEIVQQLGIKPGAGGASNGQPEQAPNDLAGNPGAPAPARAPRHLLYEEGKAMLEGESGAGQVIAGAGGFLEGMPIIGPALNALGVRGAAAVTSGLTDESYDEALNRAQMIRDASREANPGTAMAGEIAGAVAPIVAAGGTPLGARFLGVAGDSLMGRMGMGAASNAAISAADAKARGGNVGEVTESGLWGLATGAAFPMIGAGVRAATGAIGSRLAPVVNAVTNPAAEAARRVGGAMARDVKANPNALMSASDEALAQRAGIPLMNADRGGEVTRALARSAANQSPEARGAIEKMASDRFAGQAGRAANFLQNVVGGSADDIAYQEQIHALARATNRPAYNRAFQAPKAQQVYSKGLQDLMQSPTFRKAVDAVPRRSADRGAVEGFKEIPNPFGKNSQGAYVLRRRADGSLITPNLQFWDQVKINLDGFIGRAKRAGDNGLVRDLMGLKGKLVEELDGIVPAYKTARAGASAFFGQDNALDAGRAFARNPKSIPEAAKALRGYSVAEREAFAVGHASELIDTLRASKDRVNVINQMFKSDASRMQMQMVYGPRKAAQIEAYVRVEDIVDRLRGAMGNSTTARQLVEMGLGAGAGYTFSGGDLTGAAAGALLARGGRFAVQRAESNVLQRMAALLTTDDPRALKMAVDVAAKSPKYMAALEMLERRIGLPARGLAIAGQRH